MLSIIRILSVGDSESELIITTVCCVGCALGINDTDLISSFSSYDPTLSVLPLYSANGVLMWRPDIFTPACDVPDTGTGDFST